MSKRKKQNPDINFLVQYLRDCCIANIDATFVAMNELIGDNVQFNSRWKLTKALQIVQDEYGFVMESIGSVGYRYIQSTDVSERVSAKRLSKARSQTRMWRKELDSCTKGRALSMADLCAYSQVALVDLVLDEQTQNSAKKLTGGKAIDWRVEQEKTRKLLMEISI